MHIGITVIQPVCIDIYYSYFTRGRIDVAGYAPSKIRIEDN